MPLLLSSSHRASSIPTQLHFRVVDRARLGRYSDYLKANLFIRWPLPPHSPLAEATQASRRSHYPSSVTTRHVDVVPECAGGILARAHRTWERILAYLMKAASTVARFISPRDRDVEIHRPSQRSRDAMGLAGGSFRCGMRSTRARQQRRDWYGPVVLEHEGDHESFASSLLSPTRTGHRVLLNITTNRALAVSQILSDCHHLLGMAPHPVHL